ncbi:MAG: hypothetical protein LBR07_01530, partial [Puniceicoccales bacterium]|nr:hypothetical protein [Puniceicoccales bacterium]
PPQIFTLFRGRTLRNWLTAAATLLAAPVVLAFAPAARAVTIDSFGNFSGAGTAKETLILTHDITWDLSAPATVNSSWWLAAGPATPPYSWSLASDSDAVRTVLLRNPATSMSDSGAVYAPFQFSTTGGAAGGDMPSSSQSYFSIRNIAFDAQNIQLSNGFFDVENDGTYTFDLTGSTFSNFNLGSGSTWLYVEGSVFSIGDGATDNYPDVTIIGGTFIGNHTRVNGDGDGGAGRSDSAGAIGINRGSVTFAGTMYFEGNYTHYYGGAIAMHGYVSGGKSNLSSLPGSSLTFVNNHASYYGGALDFWGYRGNHQFQGYVLFKNNYIAGGDYADPTTGSILSYTYPKRGGAINIGFLPYSVTLHFTGGADFIKNRVIGGNDGAASGSDDALGGAFASTNQDVESGLLSSGYGNATDYNIKFSNSGDPTHTVSFVGNYVVSTRDNASANALGGAIFIKGSSQTILTVENALFDGNWAGSLGAAARNTALGGAIFLYRGTVNITGNSTFQNNYHKATAVADTTPPGTDDAGNIIESGARYVRSGGEHNAIYIAADGTLNLGAVGEDFTTVINFYDPIEVRGAATVVKDGAGYVRFHTYESYILGNTTVKAGTFHLLDGATYGAINASNANNTFSILSGGRVLLERSARLFGHVFDLSSGGYLQIAGDQTTAGNIVVSDTNTSTSGGKTHYAFNLHDGGEISGVGTFTFATSANTNGSSPTATAISLTGNAGVLRSPAVPRDGDPANLARGESVALADFPGAITPDAAKHLILRSAFTGAGTLTKEGDGLAAVILRDTTTGAHNPELTTGGVTVNAGILAFVAGNLNSSSLASNSGRSHLLFGGVASAATNAAPTGTAGVLRVNNNALLAATFNELPASGLLFDNQLAVGSDPSAPASPTDAQLRARNTYAARGIVRLIAPIAGTKISFNATGTTGVGTYDRTLDLLNFTWDLPNGSAAATSLAAASLSLNTGTVVNVPALSHTGATTGSTAANHSFLGGLDFSHATGNPAGRLVFTLPTGGSTDFSLITIKSGGIVYGDRAGIIQLGNAAHADAGTILNATTSPPAALLMQDDYGLTRPLATGGGANSVVVPTSPVRVNLTALVLTGSDNQPVEFTDARPFPATGSAVATNYYSISGGRGVSAGPDRDGLYLAAALHEINIHSGKTLVITAADADFTHAEGTVLSIPVTDTPVTKNGALEIAIGTGNTITFAPKFEDGADFTRDADGPFTPAAGGTSAKAWSGATTLTSGTLAAGIAQLFTRTAAVLDATAPAGSQLIVGNGTFATGGLAQTVFNLASTSAALAGANTGVVRLTAPDAGATPPLVLWEDASGGTTFAGVFAGGTGGDPARIFKTGPETLTLTGVTATNGANAFIGALVIGSSTGGVDAGGATNANAVRVADAGEFSGDIVVNTAPATAGELGDSGLFAAIAAGSVWSYAGTLTGSGDIHVLNAAPAGGADAQFTAGASDTGTWLLAGSSPNFNGRLYAQSGLAALPAGALFGNTTDTRVIVTGESAQLVVAAGATLNAQTVLVAGTGSASAPSAINAALVVNGIVNAGTVALSAVSSSASATLAGSGVIRGAEIGATGTNANADVVLGSGAVHNPGNDFTTSWRAVGTQLIQGKVTLAAGATLKLDVESRTVHDVVKITGAAGSTAGTDYGYFVQPGAKIDVALPEPTGDSTETFWTTPYFKVRVIDGWANKTLLGPVTNSTAGDLTNQSVTTTAGTLALSNIAAGWSVYYEGTGTAGSGY